MYDKIDTAIKELGDNPVEALRERNICGRRSDSLNCPIARYLYKELEDHTLEVDGDAVWFKDPESGLWEEYDLPHHINQFVARFDGGHVPILEEVEKDA